MCNYLLESFAFTDLVGKEISKFSDHLGAAKPFVTLLAVVIGIYLLFLYLATPSYTALEPSPLRTHIPFLGHALSFVRDQRGFFEQADQRCGQKPFTMYVAGEKMYIFSRADDVAQVMRQSRTLGITVTDQKQFRKNIVGFRENDANKIASLRSDDIGILNKFLLNAGKLDGLVAKFIECQERVLFKYKNRIEETNGTAELDGFNLIGELLLQGTTSTFFGKDALGDTDLFTDYRRFLSEGFWARMMGLPHMFYMGAIEARERMKRRLANVVGVVNDDTTNQDTSELVRSSIRILYNKEGLSKPGIVSHLFDLFFLGANLNSIPMAYLTLLHIITDLSLQHTIIAELRALSVSTLTPNQLATHLPHSLPHLHALFKEVMRYHTTAWSAREVLSDTFLTVRTPPTSSSETTPPHSTSQTRTYELKKGSIVAMPSSLLHHNPETHTNPEIFDATRFLSKKLGGKGISCMAKELRPFGGGISYCPGRLFAEKQVVGFLALLLSHFDIIRVGKEVEIPRNADFFYVTKQKGWELLVTSRK